MMNSTDGRDDGELVAAVLAGQREACGPLLARWQASVLRLCRRLLGPGPQAEDVAQEAAVQAFLGLPRLVDPTRSGAWLHAIAANRARMALRRRRRLTLDGLPPDAAKGLGGGDSGPTPEEAWAAREVHEAILAALRELPPATREAVIGFYLQGYSYAELAELLGTPLSTVRGRLYHGRRQLRRTLRPLAEEVLTPAPTRREEHRMDTTALIDVDVAFVGRLAFSTDCVVMLLRRRVAERAGPPPPSPIAPPPPLDPRARRRVEDCLERLRAELSGWLALLTHDSGTLVAWAGPGDPAAMARYCQARADRDADLTHLVMREVFPADQVEAVVFRSVGRLWRVEVGIAAEESEAQRARVRPTHRPSRAGTRDAPPGENRCRQVVRPR